MIGPNIRRYTSILIFIVVVVVVVVVVVETPE